MGGGSSTANGQQKDFSYSGPGPCEGKPPQGAEVWALCDQGKLFKVVENARTSQEKWSLYNDTKDREILVEWAFGPKCKVAPIGIGFNAGTGADGAQLVRGVIPAGKTQPFVQGTFSGYSSKWMLHKPGEPIPANFRKDPATVTTQPERSNAPPPPPQQQVKDAGSTQVTPSQIAIATDTPPLMNNREQEERERRLREEQERRLREEKEERERRLREEQERRDRDERERRLREEQERLRREEAERKREDAARKLRAKEKKAERARLWTILKMRLPSDRSSASKVERKRLFKAFDTQSMKRLTAYDCISGCRRECELDQLVDKPEELDMIVTKAFNVARGMSTAEDATSEDSKYVEFREFRLFFANTKLYFEMWVMFDELDESDDGQVEFKEFKNAVPRLKEFGVDIKNPEAEFREIDKDGGGVVNFHEFARWAIAKNLDCDGESEGDELEARGNK